MMHTISNGQYDELPPWIAMIMVTIPLIITHMPQSERADMWRDPMYRALLLAISIGFVVKKWQDALVVFFVVWFVVDFMYELNEARSVPPVSTEVRSIRND